MCPDVDGLKTGFTRKSGYHIVVTAQRDGMRLMAVVMGAKSSSVRDREARRLIEEGFRMARSRRRSYRNDGRSEVREGDTPVGFIENISSSKNNRSKL